VFQITYKGRGSIRNLDGSIDVDLFKSSQVDHLFCRVMLPALSGFWPKTPLLSGTLHKAMRGGGIIEGSLDRGRQFLLNFVQVIHVVLFTIINRAEPPCETISRKQPPPTSGTFPKYPNFLCQLEPLVGNHAPLIEHELQRGRGQA